MLNTAVESRQFAERLWSVSVSVSVSVPVPVPVPVPVAALWEL
ncbi:hypothetical protein [Agromyces sp. Soil535]|nr:hypothetical protein [Agromyces sp. Soil535]